MKRPLTHLGTTPSGKKVFLEKLPHEYPRFSKSDHLYAAVLHGANRTRGGAVAGLHRLAAGEGGRSRVYKNGGSRAHSTIKSDEQWEAQVTERRKRDPGAWSSRSQLITVARRAAENVFSGRKVMTPALIKKAQSAAFNAIRRHDPLSGTSEHPAAAYSHGIAELAAEGTSQAERAWVPAKEIRRGTWAKAGKKFVSHDKRFAIVKDNGGYNLIDLDTYNEYSAASLEAAKSKAAQIRSR